MMVRLWLVLGCSAMLWVFGTIAPAQTTAPVMVRSGDHDGFSRLVLDLPRRVEWTLSKRGSERVLGLAGSGWAFDTDSVFERMQGDRISALETAEGGNGLRIGVGCACEIDVFWHGRAMLVVDVRDAPSGAKESAAQISGEGPELPAATAQTAATLTAATLIPLLPADNANDELSQDGAPSSGQADSVETGAGLGPARQQLSRQLARAASMGLLTARENPGVQAVGQHASPGQALEADTVESEPAVAAKRAESVVRPGMQLRAETSIDRDVLDHLAESTLTHQGVICLPDLALAVATWGRAGGFADQIGPARARLTGEFDQIGQAAAIDLARLYLHFGFGAEAGQVLRAAGATGDDAKIALALARVMDGSDAEHSRLAGQLSCDSAAAFWSALAHTDLPSDTPIAENAILRTVNELPTHLREHLAPRLARKFTAADQPGMAERILRILERGGDVPSPAQGLARAEVDLADGRTGSAERGLEDVVAANNQSSAEALVRRIDARIRGGRAISRELADLAGAYAQEHRDTAIGHDLARAYIEARAATGAFDQAFADRARLAPALPKANRRHVSDTVMNILAKNADDLTFLHYALDAKAQDADTLGGSAGNAVAARLVALGFPQVARAYVHADAVGPDQRARQILRAEIALAQNRPGQAQVDILGLVGEGVNRLRARAQSMAGGFRAAHLLFIADGDSGAARLAAMQAEDWDQAAALGDEDIARLAELADAAPEGAEADNNLTQNRKLLETSEAVRASVSGLLTARPVSREAVD